MDTQRDQNPSAPVQPSSSVPVQGGAVRGEHEVAAVTALHPDGLIVPTEQVPVLHPEVQQAGLRVVPPNPQLTLEDRQAGLSHSGPDLPVRDVGPTVELPSIQEIQQGRKLSPNASARWGAELFHKVLSVFSRRKAA